ncbi:MAG: glycosyltransferase [Candidatus Bathyarchaeia archaeon]
MKPKVTIGICVKNSEATIKETIESILAQDFPYEQTEIIIVDGNSTDKTLSILMNCLENANIRTYVFHENEGLGTARQIVVENANGDYILWVDGDIILSRNYIRRQVEFMEQNPKVGIAKGKLPLKMLKNTLATLEMLSRPSVVTTVYKSKIHSNALGTGGSIYRTQAIKQAGGFDKNLRGYCEDWDAEIRIQEAGWFLARTNVKYLDYERHGLTWKNLWARYWERGYYTHYFLHKRPGLLRLYKMLPPAALLAGLLYAEKLFKLLRKGIVFLLPLQYLFKSAAWYAGFITSHLHNYEPKTLQYKPNLRITNSKLIE